MEWKLIKAIKKAMEKTTMKEYTYEDNDIKVIIIKKTIKLK